MAENLNIVITADNTDALTKLNQSSQAVTNFGNKLKETAKPTADATNALSNLSRVAQDAPYGFMGIANNLNPLLESFQRLSKETGSAGGALKSMAAGLMGPAGIGVALGVVSSLIVAFGDDISDFFTRLSEGDSKSKQFKESLSGIGSEFTNAVEKVNKVEIAFKEYHNGLLTGDQALKIYNESLGKNLGVKSNINEAEKIFKDKSADYVEASLQRSLADAASKKAAEELLKVKTLELTGIKGPAIGGNLRSFLFGSDKAVESEFNTQILKSKVAESQEIIKNFKQIAQDASDASIKLSTSVGINLDPEKLKKVPKTKDYSLQDDIAALENDTKATIKWADEQMKIYNRMLDFWKKYGDIVKAETGVSSIREMLAKQDKEREKKDETPFSERKADIKLPVAIQNYISNVKKFDKDIADANEKAKEFAKTLAKDVTDGFLVMFDAIQQGKNPLLALGDYLGQLVKQFAAAIIQATIFKGIMSLLNTATGGGGGFFGGILGSVGKLLGMAEGGIVSRPTLAMVGEGGQSEAVMPLNKLGNMMNSTFNAGAMSGVGGGSGSGQFVLKGNDLVLALQRSNYSLNLRRGNGI